MSQENEMWDYYQKNPQAETPPQGSVDNDTRIKAERVRQEVQSSIKSSTGETSGSGGNK